MSLHLAGQIEEVANLLGREVPDGKKVVAAHESPPAPECIRRQSGDGSVAETRHGDYLTTHALLQDSAEAVKGITDGSDGAHGCMDYRHSNVLCAKEIRLRGAHLGRVRETRRCGL